MMVIAIRDTEVFKGSNKGILPEGTEAKVLMEGKVINLLEVETLKGKIEVKTRNKEDFESITI